jgi:hypothetical protein
METTKYTKEELEQMVASCGFAYGTPARQAAEENAAEYDYDSDTLDVRECVEDAYIYGIIWCLEHLK